MIEVVLETIQMSLVSSHRIVVLKETTQERYLPIWIGPCEAEAISVCVNGVETPRPLTHDLLVHLLETLGANLQYIYVNDLADNTFFARLVLDVNGAEVLVDSRPSDAIAIAVRVGAPIYVAETVMEEAGVIPEQDITIQAAQDRAENLSVFRDFLKTLDSEDSSREADE